MTISSYHERHPRLIRRTARTPYVSFIIYILRILFSPFTWLLRPLIKPLIWIINIITNWNEQDKLTEKYAIFFVIFCQILFISTCIWQQYFSSPDILRKRSHERIIKTNQSFHTSFSNIFRISLNTSINWISIWIAIGLFVWSLFCTIRCFTVSKKYSLFERRHEHPPPTLGAHCTIRSDTSPSTPGFLARFCRNTSVDISTNTSTSSRTSTSSNEYIWELTVWNPSTLLIYFFCFFNPIHLILLWNHPLSPKHLILAATIAFQLFFLHRIYAGYVADKSIIHSEVFYEYSKKFVEPRLFSYKRNVATSTHPDIVQVDIHTPHAKPIKNIHQPSLHKSNRIRSLIEEEWHTPSKTRSGTFKGFPISPMKNVQPSPAKGFRPANVWSVNTSGNNPHLFSNTKINTKHP
ncbi:hypothetical protein PCANB_003000 [Pneumocystis canis]|nr:hypothetical protein PCANB_003000 [Pneumocystis canis]